MSEKRCPHCQQWSSYNGELDARCAHCNLYLREAERVDKAQKEARRKQLELDFQKNWPFHVKPGDTILLVLVKKAGYGIYVVFMTIMSVLLWIIFWLAS